MQQGWDSEDEDVSRGVRKTGKVAGPEAVGMMDVDCKLTSCAAWDDLSIPRSTESISYCEEL